MPLTALEIYLSKARKLTVRGGSGRLAPPSLVATFNRNIGTLGFTLSPDLMAALSQVGEDEIAALYKEVVLVLEKMVGAHRQFKPMYPNFPKQVMEASALELYLNAMRHYWGSFVADVLKVPVRLLPEYTAENRAALPEDEITLRVIGLGTDADFGTVFTRLIGANGSLPDGDKEIVRWFVDNRRADIPRLLPASILQKENLALLIGSLLAHEVPGYLLSYLKTATDVLRVAVVMSGGDVSLAKPSKFRRFKRSERRFLLDALEAVPSVTEDMLRRPEVWKRLGRELRPGDYSARYPKALAAFGVVRNDEPFETFGGKIEKGLLANDLPGVTELLTTRPGDFARRLDHLLRKAGEEGANRIIEGFRSVAHKVSTPVLLQAYAHFSNRDRACDHRAFFPKGSVAKVHVIDEPLPALPTGTAARLALAVRGTLCERFAALPSLGRVYVDEALKQQFVPTARRSAAKSLRTISRGSRLALPDCTTLRFFVWWTDGKSRTDIDLSAVFFGHFWERLGQVAYFNLKEWGCAHSGDITSAPNGAAEFIDVDISALQAKGVRYVQMVLNSFTQQPYCDLPECFAGWMTRSAPQSGEVFEARTVRDRIDVASDTTVCIPLIVDLADRQVVWADIALKSRSPINNVRRNGDSLTKMGKAVCGLVKPTLYDLFAMHAEARGVVVRRAEAQTVFSLSEGITPFDQDTILSEFIGDGKEGPLGNRA